VKITFRSGCDVSDAFRNAANEGLVEVNLVTNPGIAMRLDTRLGREDERAERHLERVGQRAGCFSSHCRRSQEDAGRCYRDRTEAGLLEVGIGDSRDPHAPYVTPQGLSSAARISA
jgi:hypothetical protein